MPCIHGVDLKQNQCRVCIVEHYNRFMSPMQDEIERKLHGALMQHDTQQKLAAAGEAMKTAAEALQRANAQLAQLAQQIRAAIDALGRLQ